MNDFTEKNVIITGATRGIGAATASAFLSLGAHVTGLYSSDEDSAKRCRDSMGEKSHNFDIQRCDVSDEAQVTTFFRNYEAHHDKLDILVNSAGIRRDGIVALLKATDWQRVLDINLTGSFLMAKNAVHLMLKKKFGRIINITSPMAYLGFAGQANYAASKAGQVAMTKSLAKEVARKKITVNAVSPGFIDTDFISDLSAEQLANYKKMIPMKRFGRADEVAKTILFLCSNDASYITGSTIEITGGL